MEIPEVIPIRRMKDLHTEFVGRCTDGTQFFLNEAFVRIESESKNWQENRHEYLVLYLFDPHGNYLSHKYWYGGTTATCNTREYNIKRKEMLASLGKRRFCDIAVRPFSVEIDGIIFGLIVDPEYEGVHLEPHAQITFSEPWDGEYET